MSTGTKISSNTSLQIKNCRVIIVPCIQRHDHKMSIYFAAAAKLFAEAMMII